MTRKPIALALLLFPVVAPLNAADDRRHIEAPIELASGEAAGMLHMTAGRVRLASGSSAASIRLENGNLQLEEGSSSGPVFVGNAEATIAGRVDGDVTCGTGDLRIAGTAEITGAVVNLGCALDIDGGARIAGDVVSFGNSHRLGPDLVLPGRLALLPGRDARSKVRDRPTLELRQGTRLEGGLWLDHCVVIESARDVQAPVHGIRPHDPLARPDPDEPSCRRLPGTAGEIDRATLPGPRVVFVHKSPETGDPGPDDAILVHTGLELRGQAGTIRTINGAVVVHEGASAKALDILNGAVVMRPGTVIPGPVTIANGPLVIQREARVGGAVTVATSSIELAPGARIDGDITQFGGDVVLAEGARVAGLRFARADDRRAEGGMGQPTLKLHRADQVTGPLVLEREITIKVKQGPAPEWTGVTPNVKAGRR